MPLVHRLEFPAGFLKTAFGRFFYASQQPEAQCLP